MTRLHFHPHSGAIAVSTTLRGREGEAAHARVPLLHLVDGADPAGAPTGTPIHTGACCMGGCRGGCCALVVLCRSRDVRLESAAAAASLQPCCALPAGLGFWTARDSSDSTVSKLRFPRYAYVVRCGSCGWQRSTWERITQHVVAATSYAVACTLAATSNAVAACIAAPKPCSCPLPAPAFACASSGKVASYDLTHGMLADFLALPPANSAGQERRLVQAVRSPKQAAWLAVSKVGGTAGEVTRNVQGWQGDAATSRLAAVGRLCWHCAACHKDVLLPLPLCAQVLSRKREGAPLSPGQCEFSLVRDSEAALTTGQWCAAAPAGAAAAAAIPAAGMLTWCLCCHCCTSSGLDPCANAAALDALAHPHRHAGCCRAQAARLWARTTSWRWCCPTLGAACRCTTPAS